MPESHTGIARFFWPKLPRPHVSVITDIGRCTLNLLPSSFPPAVSYAARLTVRRLTTIRRSGPGEGCRIRDGRSRNLLARNTATCSGVRRDIEAIRTESHDSALDMKWTNVPGTTGRPRSSQIMGVWQGTCSFTAESLRVRSEMTRVHHTLLETGIRGATWEKSRQRAACAMLPAHLRNERGNS